MFNIPQWVNFIVGLVAGALAVAFTIPASRLTWIAAAVLAVMIIQFFIGYACGQRDERRGSRRQ